MSSLSFAISQNNIDMIKYHMDINSYPLLTKDLERTMDEKTLLFLLRNYKIEDIENADSCLMRLIKNDIGEKIIQEFIQSYSYCLKVNYKKI
jgi:hypothetical protein